MDRRLTRRAVLAGFGGAVGLFATGCVGWTDSAVTPLGSAASNTFALRGVKIFDGERIVDADMIVVERGLISGIGRDLPVPADAAVHDGRGGTVLPGLVDAHVHSYGGGEFDAVRFGVTTMLDMFSSVSVLGPARQRRSTVDDVQAADLWGAGTLVTAPGGHGTQYGLEIPTLAPEADADAFVADRVAEGSDFIKIVFDDGSAYQLSIPTLTETQVAEVVDAAHRRGLLAIVHISTVDAAAVAVAAGADLLAHVPVDRPLDQRLLDDMRERGTGVVATMSVDAGQACTDDAARLAADPHIMPFLTRDQQSQLRRSWGDYCQQGQADAETGAANVALLQEAGIPVLSGTDAGNPGTTHGASMHLELELLVRGGLSPVEALTAATAVPARLFRLSDRGRLAVGTRADLLLTPGDPTADITATRELAGIWKNGYFVNREAA